MLEIKVPDNRSRLLGVYPDMPEREYRAAPGINKSGMDNFLRSPRHYLTCRENPPPPTKAMIVGSAFHTLVLEPEKFHLEYVPDRYPGKSSKAAEEWRQLQREEGKIIIDTLGGEDIWNASDWDRLHLMRDAVMQHPLAPLVLSGVVEQSLFWIDKSRGEDYDGTGKLCKARIDSYNQDHDVIVDLKSARDASYSGFQSSVHKYGYQIQAAFYTDGWRACGQTCQEFLFVVVEKDPPYGVGCYYLPEDWLHVGRMIYQRVLMRYADCMKKNEWPCYPPEIRQLDMPGYAKYHKIS